MRACALAFLTFAASPGWAASRVTDTEPIAFSVQAHVSGDAVLPAEEAQKPLVGAYGFGLAAEVGWLPRRDSPGAIGLLLHGDLSSHLRRRAGAGVWGFIPLYQPNLLAWGLALAGGASYGFGLGPAPGPALWWKVAPQVRVPAHWFFPTIGLFVRGDHPLSQLDAPVLSAGLELDLLAMCAVAATLFF